MKLVMAELRINGIMHEAGTYEVEDDTFEALNKYQRDGVVKAPLSETALAGVSKTHCPNFPDDIDSLDASQRETIAAQYIRQFYNRRKPERFFTASFELDI